MIQWALGNIEWHNCTGTVTNICMYSTQDRKQNVWDTSPKGLLN